MTVLLAGTGATDSYIRLVLNTWVFRGTGQAQTPSGHVLPRCSNPRSSQILRVSRKTYDEGLPILYVLKNFDITPSDLILQLLPLLSVHNASLICHIALYSSLIDYGNLGLIKAFTNLQTLELRQTATLPENLVTTDLELMDLKASLEQFLDEREGITLFMRFTQDITFGLTRSM